MSQFILTKKDNIAAYFSIHAYGQLWVYPYGYTEDLAPDNELLVSEFRKHIHKLLNNWKINQCYKYKIDLSNKFTII